VDKTLYYRFDTGALRAVTVTVTDENEQVPPPAGAVEITEAEYQQERATLEANNAQLVTDRRAAETAAKQDAYEALLTAGIPDAAAQQISGYRPPQEPAA
jgi:alkyl hydroperoxide reductase subunit AhpF